jgi:hypothetical protein
MRGLLLSELLALPVRMHGISLGRPVDALLDEGGERVIGFEIVCGDGAHRFLPFPVARIRPDGIAVESALTLLDERDLDYYRARATRVDAARLAESWVDDDGFLHEARTAA